MSVIPALSAGLTGTRTVPAIDFVPGAVMKKENLFTRMPLLGFVPEGGEEAAMQQQMMMG